MKDDKKISELTQVIITLTAKIDELLAKISEKDALIEYYEQQLLLSKRRQFGVSSEKTVINEEESQQLVTPLMEATETNESETTEEVEEISYRRKKRKGKREEDLSGLPVERVDHEIPEEERACPECGKTMRDIGVNVRRELKIVPAQVVVVEHATHAYVCDECDDTKEKAVIIKAEAPKSLIGRSLASPSLVAYIALQKYVFGMPLYRIEKGFKYDDVIVTRQTMANWVIMCVERYLYAMYTLMIRYLLEESSLHADETTVQVLHEPKRDAKTRSYEWVYRTSGYAKHPVVIYDYKETRHQEHPVKFLKYFKGYLHTDGYQAYHNLPPDITIVGCWAHARRPWENMLKAIPENKRKGSDAETGVLYMKRLFDLERVFKELTPEERYQQRLKKSKPIADAFFKWAESLQPLPKSLLGKAVNYALAQRQYLENVFLDGRLELSNNRCERSVKPFVMGRKAWLFCNTPSGAIASSVMYSIAETAKENGLHPFHYVKYLLESLPNATTKDIEAFLPWSDSLPDYCYAPKRPPNQSDE